MLGTISLSAKQSCCHRSRNGYLWEGLCHIDGGRHGGPQRRGWRLRGLLRLLLRQRAVDGRELALQALHLRSSPPCCQESPWNSRLGTTLFMCRSSRCTPDYSLGGHKAIHLQSTQMHASPHCRSGMSNLWRCSLQPLPGCESSQACMRGPHV